LVTKKSYNCFIEGLGAFLKNYPEISMKSEVPVENYDDLDDQMDMIMEEEGTSVREEDENTAMIDVEEDKENIDEEEKVPISD
jgi:hypothetical protein